MNLSNINWDIEHAGTWPTQVKAGIGLLLSLVVAGLGYYVSVQDQVTELTAAGEKESQLKSEFEGKQQKASNLEEYKQQLVEMEKTFGDLLRQLPDKTQVPDLLVDVSQTGLATGLEFEMFKPAAEIPKEFYAELPIDIRVIGNYMEFATFVSGLASLPRIVTIHDVKIMPSKAGADANAKGKTLTMEAKVKTYRYLEEGGVKPGREKKLEKKS